MIEYTYELNHGKTIKYQDEQVLEEAICMRGESRHPIYTGIAMVREEFTSIGSFPDADSHSGDDDRWNYSKGDNVEHYACRQPRSRTTRLRCKYVNENDRNSVEAYL